MPAPIDVPVLLYRVLPWGPNARLLRHGRRVRIKPGGRPHIDVTIRRYCPTLNKTSAGARDAEACVGVRLPAAKEPTDGRVPEPLHDLILQTIIKQMGGPDKVVLDERFLKS